MSETWHRPTAPPTAQQLIVLSGLAGAWDNVTSLLDQVRETMQADEAALLLLDSSGSMLIPVASSGLEAPTHSGFRVPVGHGFAGRIAATGEPLILEDVSPATVLNPAIHRRGIHSLLGVPVPGRPSPLGVVHVGSVEPRRFTEEETARLEQFAAQLSEEILRRRASEEHLAALSLQRSLLPSLPPNVQGLDLAARYIPADGDLGGDWYDVFRFPDGRVGIVMGDVAGHGLASAVVMGRLRSALRAYALEHPDPAHVLTLLDAKISHFEPGTMATVLYAVAESPFDRFTFSSAGHPPPFLVPTEGAALAAEVAPDLPLGVRLGGTGTRTRRNTTVELPIGASLVMFTDGLFERRPRAGHEEAGLIDLCLDRLRAVLRPSTADALCTAAIAEMVGDEIVEDDIAIVVVRRLTPQPSQI